MATFESTNIKKINVGDAVFKIMTEEDEKKLKGYQYDSLVYRYIRAREQMAEYEYLRDVQSNAHNNKCKEWTTYRERADRDILRFCQILNDAIGEHD